ncbi:hypothetical protein PC120_g26749 [Phytophthora cactorum]|nr:hypothetical protein PC120_g26749 [Phytophthora cactorum]
MRRAESILETPRGRELFNEFLEPLARQPAPSEEPTQSGTTIDAPVEITTTTVSRPHQGVAFSMDPSRPSLQPVGNARGDAPMVTPACATSDCRIQSGKGDLASGLSHKGSGRTQGLVQSGVERPGAAGATARANHLAGGRGTLPVQSTVTPTVGLGTSTANSALQTFLVDTLSQALQRLSVKSEAPTPALRAQATACLAIWRPRLSTRERNLSDCCVLRWLDTWAQCPEGDVADSGVDTCRNVHGRNSFVWRCVHPSSKRQQGRGEKWSAPTGCVPSSAPTSGDDYVWVELYWNVVCVVYSARYTDTCELW